MSSNLIKIVAFDNGVTVDRMEDILGKCIDTNERQLLYISKYNKNVTWLNYNTHLYSSVKGTPVWLSTYMVLNKIKSNYHFYILTETKGKIDSLDYILEIKNSLKPEFITILSSGLSEIVGIKDDV